MKIKHIITVMLISVWLFAGCSTVKSWLGIGEEDQQEQLVPPPPEHEVSKNPDGSYNFTDEQLSGRSTWFKWATLSVFLVGSGLIVRYVIKRNDS